MTRVFSNQTLAEGDARLRVLVLGAGAYPKAVTHSPKRPVLSPLTSVGPSVRTFVTKLLTVWRSDLAVPLGTIDLLLSETAAPNGRWTKLDVAGEAADGTAIEPPTLANVDAALDACLEGAREEDHFLFLCCGHGFWKSHAYFVLSDFGAPAGDPWRPVIDLDGFRLGLSQIAPRTQWLFFDCCQDIPEKILSTLGAIGNPLIQTTAEELARAKKKFKPLAQFGFSSTTPGQQAFGVRDAPSRFCETLIEALDGAGAVCRRHGQWWIDDRGVVDAVRSYALRHPELTNSEFYAFAAPFSNDMPFHIRFRSVANEPKSRFVTFAKPGEAMKTATIVVTREGAVDPIHKESSNGRTKLLIELPARLNCTVSATFGKQQKKVEVFGALPIAEPDGFWEFVL
jgi:Caspase domain